MKIFILKNLGILEYLGIFIIAKWLFFTIVLCIYVNHIIRSAMDFLSIVDNLMVSIRMIFLFLSSFSFYFRVIFVIVFSYCVIIFFNFFLC
ncbi:hypothetical protein NBO_32g0017 [Nosema bombycis CQ1]|uniref:Uncharacterized protein n=1 Tax=Nosema bombycis (strain CQ1 / CVCC 102059) TaxID=578461 RepID=R0KVJ7_NOSB1|nr:hypothetical protein NBO_32g0017 [Nosema bombycis CQ1]|eukprot:EOB14242.1 hypothetical protein NBO_32g0017 [Nosema bombycis CQ1]